MRWRIVSLSSAALFPLGCASATQVSTAAHSPSAHSPSAHSPTTWTPPPGKTAPAAGQFDFHPFDPPDSAHRVVYNDDLVTDPVPANTKVPVTEQAYRAELKADGVDEYSRPGTPSKTLRRVSSGYPSPNASTAPHLAWVLTVHTRVDPGPVPHRDQAFGGQFPTPGA